MVEYSTGIIHGDKNHTYQFAKVGSVVFCAFPYQSYSANFGEFKAIVGNLIGHWSVSIYRILRDGTGRIEPIDEPIKTFELPEEDAAFEYAAFRLVELGSKASQGMLK